MAKLELYKIAQKGNLPDVLVPDRDILDFSYKLSAGEAIGKKTFSKALSAVEHDEGLEVILQVGSQKDIESILEKKSDIKKRDMEIKEEVHERIRDALYDTSKMEELMYTEGANMYLNYFLNASTSSKGFRGKLHKFFPIIFILHNVPAYALLASVMMLIEPKNYKNCKMELKEHYDLIEKGIHMMYDNIGIKPVLNRSLGIINKIIKEDEYGEGYANAFRVSKRLTLPQAVADHLNGSTQASEHTQWTIYQKVPVTFATLPNQNE